MVARGLRTATAAVSLSLRRSCEMRQEFPLVRCPFVSESVRFSQRVITIYGCVHVKMKGLDLNTHRDEWSQRKYVNKTHVVVKFDLQVRPRLPKCYGN